MSAGSLKLMMVAPVINANYRINAGQNSWGWDSQQDLSPGSLGKQINLEQMSLSFSYLYLIYMSSVGNGKGLGGVRMEDVGSGRL